MRTYQLAKSVDDFFQEGRELFKKNNKELNFFGLQPDINAQLYNDLDEVGRLRIYTIREDEVLIGYCIFLLQASLQYQDSIQARQDVLFIDPEHRGYGVAFLLWCEKQLQQENISFVFRSVPKIKDWSLILKRLDYKEVETIYMKDIRL